MSTKEGSIMSEVTLTRIDDLAAQIKAELQAAKEAAQSTIEHALKCGELLLEAKAKLNHGLWLPWLTKSCGMSKRSAQRYMQLAKHRAEIEAKCATLAHLTLDAAVTLISLPEAPRAPEPEPEPEPELDRLPPALKERFIQDLFADHRSSSPSDRMPAATAHLYEERKERIADYEERKEQEAQAANVFALRISDWCESITKTAQQLWGWGLSLLIIAAVSQTSP
jgi:hypothetical protein